MSPGIGMICLAVSRLTLKKHHYVVFNARDFVTDPHEHDGKCRTSSSTEANKKYQKKKKAVDISNFIQASIIICCCYWCARTPRLFQNWRGTYISKSKKPWDDADNAPSTQPSARTATEKAKQALVTLSTHLRSILGHFTTSSKRHELLNKALEAL